MSPNVVHMPDVFGHLSDLVGQPSTEVDACPTHARTSALTSVSAHMSPDGGHPSAVNGHLSAATGRPPEEWTPVRNQLFHPLTTDARPMCARAKVTAVASTCTTTAAHSAQSGAMPHAVVRRRRTPCASRASSGECCNHVSLITARDDEPP